MTNRYASPPHDPHPDDFAGGVLRRHALAAGAIGTTVPYAETLSGRARSGWVDVTIEDDGLHGRPRGELHARRRVINTAELAARTAVPRNENPTADDWAAALSLLHKQVEREQH